MDRTIRGLFGAGALAMTAVPAAADIMATLAFTTPTGIVGPNDSIPVWLTLTLDPASDPLLSDSSGAVTTILSPFDLGEIGGSADEAYFSNWFRCSGTFTAVCSPGAYQFNFGYGPTSFNQVVDLNLQPGSISNWYFGSFDPVGGAAFNGNYIFYGAIFAISRSYPDPDDPSVDVFKDHFFVNTCETEAVACAFTRTVVGGVNAAIPEPASWAMLIAGFGLIGAMQRRRRALPANA